MDTKKGLCNPLWERVLAEKHNINYRTFPKPAAMQTLDRKAFENQIVIINV
jgi:hypothetical protein